MPLAYSAVRHYLSIRMNDWFFIFVFHLRGEIIRYEVVVMDENTGMALMGRTWWPDFLR